MQYQKKTIVNSDPFDLLEQQLMEEIRVMDNYLNEVQPVPSKAEVRRAMELVRKRLLPLQSALEMKLLEEGWLALEGNYD